MTCEHLGALIAERRPGVSIRQLERAAGLPRGRLSYWLLPGTTIDQIPPVPVCKEIATCIDGDLVAVVEALAADAGYPWGPPVDDPDIHELLTRYRRMTPADRETFRRVAQSLTALSFGVLEDKRSHERPA